MSKKGAWLVVLAVGVVMAVAGLMVAAGLGQSPRQRGFRPAGVDEHGQGYAAQTDWPLLWGPPDGARRCDKKGPVVFAASPVAVADISFIEPMGELKEGHIVPGDHIGINYATSPRSAPVGVYAPADGFIARVERHPYTPPAGYPRAVRHYHVYLEHSCTLFTGFVHVTELAPEILAASAQLAELDRASGSQMESVAVRVPVKAGQRLGEAWTFGLLGMVTVDLNVTNDGYLNPESYRAENWRLHAVSPFEYFPEPLRGQLLAKNPRAAPPRGGKIDFDAAGKVVGNWFLQGSGGFRDETTEPRQCGNFPCPYWEGHLALAYDYIDPAQLRVSVGHSAGLGARTPYGVRGNGPDFATVVVGSGAVAYELVALKDVSRERGYVSDDPLIEVSDETRVLGTLLVEMTEPGSLRAEIFPGKRKEQVGRFTANARVYVR